VGKRRNDEIRCFCERGPQAQIIENCGYNRADFNKRVLKKANHKREKSGSIDEFPEVEQQKPMAGTRLVRERRNLYQIYTPRPFTRPMRCYCALLRGLLNNESYRLHIGIIQRVLSRSFDKA
jgi:hypothetical protein